jgi:hypothetical protein
VGRLLLEQIEEFLFPRQQAEHGSILSRHLADVNGGRPRAGPAGAQPRGPSG